MLASGRASRIWTAREAPPTATGPYAGFNLGAHVGDEPSRVSAHRAELTRRVGGPVAFMQQVHGDGVSVLDAPPAGPVAHTDALVTTRPGLGLAVLVADCVPLLLHSEADGVVAAVHAGRAGLLAGVVAATLGVLENLGAAPDRLAAELGPCIGGCCYEVPEAVQAEVAARVPEARARTRWGAPALDIAAGVRAQLRAGGVTRIAASGRCTYEDPGLYSYRRDGVTGRFAGVVLLRP